ncbi:BTAD domain-containing putative transcriptional regulator [Microlunatus sp. Gsoil 973]|uniref:BTAD domain-containing putative transcriptional regulator n=1 Tax=Microlunatus sp. Gsoil 973 TaxID=2672569 RepID=UPI0012B4C781|nr:BTAD domain-containing putative transcriptional regulator [Microlunatus sp. Gsoil 973]QGN34979.1 AAA family ATPase [Microlunatus sp. Gsoil 973]
METVVFGEKIRRPEQRGLVRERLVGRLTDPLGPHLGLVLGPAGSGKTTLLSNVAGTAQHSAWYRAAAEDDDESALVRHLSAALGTALAEDKIIDCAGGSLSLLITNLQTIADRQVVLVIDDLHELSGTTAESALERFLQLRPQAVRVLMAGRRPPLINTSRLLVSGDLVQLDSDDLRFRSWEVEELFRAVYAHPMSPSAAAALTRRTGGWAAGLQLFHLATSRLSRPDRERAVEELSGRSRLIRSYLARNVLGGLSPQRRRFLLQTCTLGVMTGELCDALLDTDGSAAVLDELETEQFFTTSIDGGLSYRYHQVLQTYLEVVLVDELGTRTARAVYARSAELLERSGRISAAVRAYARAEDWTAVGRLAPQLGAAAPTTGDGLRGAIGLTRVPDDPMLALAAARRMLRNGRIGKAVAAYRQAESLLDDPDFHRRCATERAVATLWLPESGGSRAERTWGGYSDRAGRVSAELRNVLHPGRHSEPVSTPIARSVAALLAGDRRTALPELDLAAAHAAPDSSEQLAVRLLGQLAAVGQQPVDTVLIELDEIVLDADAAGQPWLSRMARGLQAAVLLVHHPDQARITAAEQVIIECESNEDPWGACLLGCVVGAVHRRAGRQARSEEMLDAAVRQAAALGAPMVARWVADRRLDALLVELPGLLPAAPMIKERPMIALNCLGGFSLQVDGVEIEWRKLRPRAQSLLMLLAGRCGREVHREELIDRLWPDAGATSGTRSLQVAVSSVRQCLVAAGLREGGICRRGDSYALRLPDAHDQLGRFEALVTEAARFEAADPDRALRSRLEALELYGGDLLPEVGPAEWVVEERDRLRILAASVAVDAARQAAGSGDLATAIRVARRSIDLDPYSDPAWRLLISLQQRAGDHSGAQISHRGHARVRADLGLPA